MDLAPVVTRKVFLNHSLELQAVGFINKVINPGVAVDQVKDFISHIPVKKS